MEFMAEKNGYNREQVDAYVRQLRQEYQQVFEANKALKRECDAFALQKDAIAQALIQAEMTAQNIIAQAQAEAGQMRYGGYQPPQQQGYGMQAPNYMQPPVLWS